MFAKKLFRRKATVSVAISNPTTNAVTTAAVQTLEPTATISPALSHTITIAVNATDDTIGPLGLNLLYSPEEEPIIDFIFVHGLGGGSRKTWSKTTSLDHFWPQQWLPLEPAFKRVRVHSYGYSCNWTKRKLDVCNVHDFGKALLSELSVSPALRGTNTPLVLVGHSMGGLVIKKAYILARQNVLYRSIAARMHTIYFLATPHRGSDSAQLLNNILSVGGLSHAYIADLERGSLSNQSINDDFQRYAGKVNLWSFYETRKTSVGMFGVLIVDRESATLGYDEERQTPMDADHRSICKFDSPMDLGYRILCNSFTVTIEAIEKSLLEAREKRRRDQVRALEKYLGSSELPENDLSAALDLRATGTCEWFTSQEEFGRWKDFSPKGPAIYWLRGQSGGGKSVLAGHVIDHLQQMSKRSCSYFFLKRGDQSKARLSNCLLSLALQMALRDPLILERLLAMCDENVKLDGDDVRSLWRKLFGSDVPATATPSSKHYWVIDGLDECINDGSAVSFLLSALEESTCLRVLITSRELAELESLTRRLRIDEGRTLCRRITPCETLSDIKALIQAKMKGWAIRDDRERGLLADKVLLKSNGSFLWSALVVDRMASAHGKEEISRVLEGIPSEMEPLYLETLNVMSQAPGNKALAKAVLTWSACALRPLTILELSGALGFEVKDEFPNLKDSILALCGQLLRVDRKGVVHMVHETAREFLLSSKLQSEFAVDSTAAHTRLATACLTALVSKQMRPPRTPTRAPGRGGLTPRAPFTGYACEAFSAHLASSDPNDVDLRVLTHKFLEANVLSWIEVVAQKQNLNLLVHTARNLEKYVAASTTVRPPLGEDNNILRTWATDLVRIAAKFGDVLLASPSAIHWVVLQFCPTESAVFKAASPGRKLCITGCRDTQWDDRLASVNFQQGRTTAVCHGDDLFAVALNTGLITLYDATSCQEYMTLNHSENVTILEFDAQTQLLACVGRKTIRVWDVRGGSQVWSSRLSQPLMCLAFDGDVLLAPTKANHIAAWNVADGSVLPNRPWYYAADDRFGRADPGPPCAVSISSGHGMMAVSYIGRPIALWDLEQDAFYGNCGKGAKDGLIGPYFANDLVFNPNEDIPRLAIAYADGETMLLEPFSAEVLARTRANTHTLASSSDGRLLVGADGWGTIQVYQFETLRVLCRIKSAPCNIRRLAFSGDGLRFLDIRNSECNVWEPAALLKVSGVDGRGYPIATDLSVEETLLVAQGVLIDAMVIDPQGNFIICGKEDGSVTLYEGETGTEVRRLYEAKSKCFVRMLVWQDDRQLLTCVDAANSITAWRLGMTPTDGWNIEETVFQARVNCMKAIIQTYVSQTSEWFVLSTRDTDYVYSANSQEAEPRISSTGLGPRMWVDHPQSQQHVLCIDGPTVRVLAWQDWSVTATLSLESTQGFGRPELRVKRVFPCLTGSQLLVEFSEYEGHPGTRDMTLIDSSLFRLPDSEYSPGSPAPPAPPIYADLVDTIIHIIGVSGDRFIFVDIHSWVCSADLQKPGAAYLRHFFVPYDWFSKMRGIICGFIERAGEKNIIFARHNSVMIVRNALEYSERVELAGEGEGLAVVRHSSQ